MGRYTGGNDWRIKRIHPRGVSVQADNPKPWATCDSCGLIFDHSKLHFRKDWRGSKVEKINFLVCSSCLDTPQRQIGTLMIPPDGLPIANARPENYAIDEQTPMYRATMTGNFRTTMGPPASVRIISGDVIV